MKAKTYINTAKTFSVSALPTITKSPVFYMKKETIALNRIFFLSKTVFLKYIF